MPEYTPPEYRPMELPEIDPADPDAEHKTAVHGWIRELEAAHAEQAKGQGKEYHDQYEQLARMSSKGGERKFDPISAFMIGMGSEKGLNMVLDQNAKADKSTREREDYILGMQEQAMKGNLQKMMDEGKFKQVLTQSAALEKLHAAQDRIKSERGHKEKLAEIEKTNTGRADVANIRADAVIQSAQTRAQGMGQAYRLNLRQVDALNKQYGTSYNSYVNTHKGEDGKFNGDVTVLRALWDIWQDAIVQLGEDLDHDGVPDSQQGPRPTPPGVVPAGLPSPGLPSSGGAPAVGSADEKVLVMRNGVKGRVSRKNVKTTDQIIQ
jgi:hypothetical protein